MKNRKLKAGLVVLLMVMVLGMTGCPKDKIKAAAVGVQKYGNALEAFQSGEIAAHRDGFVDDALHLKFQQDFLKAAQSGKDLDQGILVAARGGNPQSYIDGAMTSANVLLADTGFIKDPTTQASLKLLLKAATDVLDNTVTINLK